MIELYTEKYGATTSGGCDFPLDVHKDILHTIVYGPEGSGKFSLTNTWLRDKFGIEATKLRRKTWECILPSKTKPVEVALMCSSVHHVLDPTAWGQQDRNVLNKFINDTCVGSSVGQFLQKSRQKIVVIRNTEVLTINAQKNLRYLLDELQTSTCAIIMLTNALFKLLPVLVSRCRLVKRDPDPIEMERVLLSICQKENIVARQDCHEIATRSRGNWRYALNTLQMTSMGKKDQPSIARCATRNLLCNLDPNRIVGDDVVTNIRKDVYTCLTVCGVHRPGLVLRNCIKELTSDETFEKDRMREIIEMAWDVDMLMCRGSRPVMHIERFLMQLWDSGIADGYVARHGY